MEFTQIGPGAALIASAFHGVGQFIGPAKGRLACGEEGEGRMVEMEEVIVVINHSE